jgi:SAM-dependent methyltransferase
MTQPDYSPSADRNKQPILDALLQFLPAQGTALEIASGTGQHLAWFARRLPGWTWQPTEAQVSALAGIQARTVQAGLANVLAPVQLDVCADPWLPNRPGTNAAPTFNLIFCANMLHIAPWSACAALMRGSARHLAAGGVLVTYGPYLEADVPTAPGNLNFDASLRQRDARWGIRRREDVQREAGHAGLRLSARHAMPANNLLLVWEQN